MSYHWHDEYLNFLNFYLATKDRNILFYPYVSIRKKWQAASSWLFVYPRGFRDLLLYIKKKYHNPLIYITENGDFL